MKKADDELIAHIKESLTEYEEAYVPGAWERYGKKKKKRRVLFWLGSLSSAAAILLIGFAFFYRGDKTPDLGVEHHAGVPHLKKDHKSLPAIHTNMDSLASAAENLNITVTENEKVVAVQKPVVSKLPDDSRYQPGVPEAGKAIIGDKKDGIVVGLDSGNIAKAPAKENKPRSFQDFLDAEVKANAAVAKTKSPVKGNGKWEMGLVLASSMGNSKKLNMDYGISMSYAISNKVSISSGVSYSGIGASKSSSSDLNSSSMSSYSEDGKSTGPSSNGPFVSAIANDRKSLQSVETNLVGIDIPLGIKYHLTKKIYANVGVSAFAILNQKQSNNYLQGTVENESVDDSNASGFKAVFKETKVSEPVSTEEIRNDKYLGFYNISFGYQQKISDKRSLSVEPFMKLPMKEFTKENLYLMGTGIRLKFDF